MRERPILFSAPMVRAILAGTKTQTRRVVKPAGAHTLFQFRGTTAAAGADEPTGEWAWCGSERVVNKHIRCPYGKPGDRLWVRETWAARHAYDGHKPIHIPALAQWHYAATEDRGGLLWRPSIHMPRWASRITLEVTGVRVERLQEISEADALAEGVYDGAACKCAEPLDFVRSCGTCGGRLVDSVGLYRALWDQINGPGSWDANPWVWVVEFKRAED